MSKFPALGQPHDSFQLEHNYMHCFETWGGGERSISCSNISFNFSNTFLSFPWYILNEITFLHKYNVLKFSFTLLAHLLYSKLYFFCILESKCLLAFEFFQADVLCFIKHYITEIELSVFAALFNAIGNASHFNSVYSGHSKIRCWGVSIPPQRGHSLLLSSPLAAFIVAFLSPDCIHCCSPLPLLHSLLLSSPLAAFMVALLSPGCIHCCSPLPWLH